MSKLKSGMRRPAVDRLRKVCLAFPETFEKIAWKTPTFRVDQNKGKMFVLYSNPEDGRPALWCKGEEGAQEALVGVDPERFFRPPYLGVRGWIGIYLDRRVSWKEVGSLVEASYRLVAPARLAAQLDVRSDREVEE
jgi:predicted DNA-binding protein (MmcQ/YjbR family)